MIRRTKVRTDFVAAAAVLFVFAGTVSVALAKKPSPPCNPDGILDPGEGCDPGDLGTKGDEVFRDDASCQNFNYSGGELDCTDSCQVDESFCFCEVCDAGTAFPATGQDRTVVAGEDGNPAHGSPLSYTDSGATVTDDNTGLEWEKKTDDLSLNDKDNAYPWRGFCNVAGDGSGSDAECGTDADCTVAGETCNLANGSANTTIFEWVAMLNANSFAGHDDWRIPNVKELQSIVDYGRSSPNIDPTFGPTVSAFYWSAATLGVSSTNAWFVNFGFGDVRAVGKTADFFVRAVRGGS